MALTPKERADFDEIVMRLRLEDAQLGTTRSKRRPRALLAALVGTVLVLGLGVVLLDRGVLVPVLITVAVLACGVLVWRSARGRNGSTKRTGRR
jgi:hypothetical protein